MDADDVAELLGHGGEGMHLVGSSYGGVVALLAAAQRPEAVRSLTVIEPPAMAVAMEDPDVFKFAADMQQYWAEGPREPEAFLRGFLERVGSSASLPSPLPPPLDQNARLLMNERSPAEARIPLERAAARPVPQARRLRRSQPRVRPHLRRAAGGPLGGARGDPRRRPQRAARGGGVQRPGWSSS